MRYCFGEFEFDTREGRLYWREEIMRARPKLVELIHYLLSHRRQLATREELLDHLWPDVNVGQTSLSTLINEARDLLGDSGYKQQIIRTEARRGYSFVADVSLRAEGQAESGGGDLRHRLQSILLAGRSAIQEGDLSAARHCLESALQITRGNPRHSHPSSLPAD